ncbi:hypothetical protein [Xylanibacter oryzae]|uniref:hypothetical protein n=1 Tax=Xylanibacter oryzae TaxID=185293 RepID=UPI0004BC5DAA|nr:hypothetical protein [Xylanibacter oryzae]MBP7359105.1 hypothetical protein [Prevotella sp.]
MDYKYIEQLVERYFACETTLAEEEILKAFFSQEDVPANLHKYKVLFTYEQNDKKETVLGEDFDSKILSIIDEPIPVKARTITIRRRLMPLFRAAAIVAIILTLGNAAQFSFKSNKDKSDDINYSSYKDTYSDPSEAYSKVQNALELVSEGINQAQKSDSVNSVSSVINNDTTRTE